MREWTKARWTGGTSSRASKAEQAIYTITPLHHRALNKAPCSLHSMATPAEDRNVEVGIIGMGDMGRLYATKMAAAGWK